MKNRKCLSESCKKVSQSCKENGKSSKICSYLYLFLCQTFQYLTLNARSLTGNFTIRLVLLLFTHFVVAGHNTELCRTQNPRFRRLCCLIATRPAGGFFFFFFGIFHKIIRCLSRFWNFMISKTDFFHVWANTRATVLLFLWACFWSDKVVFFNFNF